MKNTWRWQWLIQVEGKNIKSPAAHSWDGDSLWQPKSSLLLGSSTCDSIHHGLWPSPRPSTSLDDPPCPWSLHPALLRLHLHSLRLPPSILSGPCHLPNLVSFPLTLEQMAGALLSLCERDWQEPVINLHRQPVVCRSAPSHPTLSFNSPPLSSKPPLFPSLLFHLCLSCFRAFHFFHFRFWNEPSQTWPAQNIDRNFYNFGTETFIKPPNNIQNFVYNVYIYNVCFSDLIWYSLWCFFYYYVIIIIFLLDLSVFKPFKGLCHQSMCLCRLHFKNMTIQGNIISVQTMHVLKALLYTPLHSYWWDRYLRNTLRKYDTNGSIGWRWFVSFMGWMRKLTLTHESPQKHEANDQET